MASFVTKWFSVQTERSAREDTCHVGFETPLGSGFFTVPTGKRELERAVGLVGAMLALRGVRRRERESKRAQRDARRRTRGTFGGRGGFGGGKRR